MIAPSSPIIVFVDYEFRVVGPTIVKQQTKLNCWTISVGPSKEPLLVAKKKTSPYTGIIDGSEQIKFCQH